MLNFKIHSFFIRTSKYCLKLAVLDFFFCLFHFWGSNVLNLFLFPRLPLQCHKDKCQTEYNKNTLFHFLQAVQNRRPLGGVLQKIGSATVLKPIKNTCEGVQFFIKVAGFKSVTLLKLNSFTGVFHRFWTQMQMYTL